MAGETLSLGGYTRKSSRRQVGHWGVEKDIHAITLRGSVIRRSRNYGNDEDLEAGTTEKAHKLTVITKKKASTRVRRKKGTMKRRNRSETSKRESDTFIYLDK